MSNQLLRFVVVFLVLAVAVAVSHFLPGLDGSAIENGFRNSLHVIGFAVFAAIIFKATPASTMLKSIAAISLAGIIGGFSEYMQSRSGRTDIFDLYRDFGGAIAYVCAKVLWDYSATPGIRRTILRTASVVTGSLILFPITYWAGIAVYYISRSPLILDFDGRFDSYLFSPINSQIEISEIGSEETDNRGQVAQIHLTHRGRSGIQMSTVVYDWTDYSVLKFEARVIEGENTTVTVHINDYEHIGRFFDTSAGRIFVTNHSGLFEIPIDAVLMETSERNIDKSDIRQIVIFARDKRNGTRMSLDNVRLE